MKACKKCGETKPYSLFYKTGTGNQRSACKACDNAAQEARHKANPEKRKATRKARYAANPEPFKKAVAEYRAANAELICATRAARYQANKEKVCAAVALYRKRNWDRVRQAAAAKYAAAPDGVRAASSDWRKANRGARAAQHAKRHAAKLQRTPPWADLQAIKALYQLAAAQNLHVDHYYPLLGKTVSGLHVEGNLQLLTKTENLRKHNRHPEASP